MYTRRYLGVFFSFFLFDTSKIVVKMFMVSWTLSEICPCTLITKWCISGTSGSDVFLANVMYRLVD